MEHSELIAEMAYIEKLSTQERLKLARRRRMQQLKKFSQRDRELSNSKREKTAQNEAQKRRREGGKAVKFISNVMLLEAAARNDIDEVKALLEMGVNPDSTNEDGLTALHQCCIDDSEDMMRLLVHHAANSNAQDSEKWTPLHAAATCGHLHLAKFLIAKGANLLAVNADGNMPYDICEDDATLDFIESEMACRGVTQRLIDDTRSATETEMLDDLRRMKTEGKSLMYRDIQSATALHVAAANGYVRVVEYLLSQNVPTEVRDQDDWSPLHAAACWGHPDVLELLVQHSANLHARTKNQETPYDICEDAELQERIMQLINEQETKRLHDQHRRIRRAHSNTRTQSVRRTSIREKTLTPKKDAQEEARMWRQMENNQPTFNEESPSLGNIREIKAVAEAPPITDFPTIIKTAAAATVITPPTNNSTAVINKKNNITNITNSTTLPRENHLLEEEEEDNFEKTDQSKDVLIVTGPTTATTTTTTTMTTTPNTTTTNNDVDPAKITLEVLPPVPDSSKMEVAELVSCSNNIVDIIKSSLKEDDVDSEIPPVPPPRSSSTIRQDTMSTAGGVMNSPGSGMITTSGEGGSKIDIHVTVTVNPFAAGTLADLKKQRALSRATQSSYTLSGASSTYSLTNNNPEYDARTPTRNTAEFSASSVRVDAMSYRPPPSPSLSPRRFCGEPSDLIGTVDGRSCCIIM